MRAPEILLRGNCSFFPRVKGRYAKIPATNNPLKWHLDEIRSGKFKEKVERVRGAVVAGDDDQIRNRKLTLGGITWAGTFIERATARLLKHSGVMPLDFDKVPDPSALKAALSADQHVLAAWISSTGRGVHALVAVEAADSVQHKACFKTASVHFGKTLGIFPDQQCRDVSRLLFVSHDPDMWIAQNEVDVFRGTGEDTHTHPSILSVSLNQSAQSTPSTYSTSSTSRGVVDAIRERMRVEQELKTRHEGRQWRIFEKFFASRTSGTGKRNSWIVATVPATYCVVSEAVMLKLCLAFYDMNVGMFGSSRSEHEKEVLAMLECRARSFPADLSEVERQTYAELGDEKKAAFRICWDMARRCAKKSGELEFHMSAGELAARLECHSMTADRIMKAFYGVGILSLVTLGTRRTNGCAGKATTWRWNLAESASQRPATAEDGSGNVSEGAQPHPPAQPHKPDWFSEVAAKHPTKDAAKCWPLYLEWCADKRRSPSRGFWDQWLQVETLNVVGARKKTGPIDGPPGWLELLAKVYPNSGVVTQSKTWTEVPDNVKREHFSGWRFNHTRNAWEAERALTMV